MAANDVPCCESMFWVYLIISVALVLFAGLMSGLTLGLMSLSLFDLEILIKAGQPHDKKNAEKILPLVKNQHLLLCTLLICNALAMEALPIFLDALLPAWGAILISVTLILAFGEIIPQAVCSRYGLSVGAKLSVVVRILVIVFFPLSYPISKVILLNLGEKEIYMSTNAVDGIKTAVNRGRINRWILSFLFFVFLTKVVFFFYYCFWMMLKLLDLVLGKKHSALLRRAELKTLVDMHGNEAGKGGELTHDETTIITGALDLAQKTAKDAMTPMSRIFSVDLNSKLNEDTMSLIMSNGHSRIPVHSGSPTNIVGLILVKSLLKLRPEDETPIRNLTIRRIPRVDDNVPLYDILNQFQKGHSHMAVVVKSKHNVKALSENKTTKSNLLKISIDSNSSLQNQGEEKGSENKLQNICSNATSVASSDTEIRSPASRPGKCGNEIIPYPVEEALGIITMEDVLEELLQEEILDETDEYVDVHDKLRINMLPPMWSSSRSPGAPSHMMWRSPVASPFSSSHPTPSSKNHTPVLRSPISPYVRSPFVRPTLYASPGKSVTSSPTEYTSFNRSSPSSHRILRKEYEKLRKANAS